MKKIILSVLCLLILASCTVKLTDVDTDRLGLLPKDSTVYISLKNAEVPELTEFFLGKYIELDSNTKKILAKTDEIYLGVKSRTKKEIDFYLLGLGKYPKSTLNFALCVSSEWKKGKAVYRYWQNKVNGMQLSVPAGDVAFASSQGIDVMLDNLSEKSVSLLRNERKAVLENSHMAIYIPEVNKDTISSIGIGDVKLRIDEFLLIVQKEEDRFSVSGEIILPNASTTKNFNIALRLMFVTIIKKFDKEESRKFRKESKVESIDNAVVFSDINLKYDDLQIFISELIFPNDEMEDKKEEEKSQENKKEE